jgi:hypothetical protein
MAASNIRNYSRLQLLIEMIIRIYRVLSDEDKQRFQDKFQAYIVKTSGQYIYRLKASDLPHELEKMGQLFHWIYKKLYPNYAQYDIFQTFERVLNEHFTVVKEKITVKDSEQLSSSNVQSPDDLDATFRDKNGKKSKGQSINVTETAHTDNDINLITDVAVNANNKDDSKILNERIDQIKKKTPDLDELHFDAAFASSDNDKKFDEHSIASIQTAIRGRQPAVSINIEQTTNDEYLVSCPLQTVKSQQTRKRFKAQFDLNVCQGCSYQSQCPAIAMKKYQVFYFTHKNYLIRKRQNRINEIPYERRKLRNNVEATVNEFTCKLPRKKLKVRGAFKTAVFAYSVAISINFGRIYRYLLDNPDSFMRFLSFVFKIGNKRNIYNDFLYIFSTVYSIFMNFSLTPCPKMVK